MSKNVTIQEDGVGKNLSLDSVRIPAVKSGNEDWLPADGVKLVNITVKQNGTYKASDFNAYGINQVKVKCTSTGGSASSYTADKDLKKKVNVAIKEGGKKRSFTANRIETPLTAGGSCRWVPKSKANLGTKTITRDNKTYKASGDGYYGFSQVVVSGISISVSTDSSGNETVTHTDDEGTVVELVPSSIVIETPPVFTGPYGNRAYIGTEGMVVKAYKGDGTLWTDADHPDGVIHEGEYTISPIITDISECVALIGSTDGIIAADPFYRMGPGSVIEWRRYLDAADPDLTEYNKAIVPDNCYAYLEYGGGSLALRFASESPTEAYHEWNSTKPGYGRQGVGTYGINWDTTYNGKHFYMGGPTVMNGLKEVYSGAKSALQAGGDGAIGYLLLYGEVLWGGQTVTVSWARPGDNRVLTDTFTVTVVDISPGGGAVELSEVEEAIRTSMLLGIDEVYIRGVAYSMADAIALRDSLRG